ncbi:MAG: sulfurtransferase [Mycobacterium leprae]
MGLSGPVITPQALATMLAGGPLLLADCRFDSADPEAGLAWYAQSHIPGAVYFHLDRDLSSPMGEHGGRHPLPDPATLAARLRAAGLEPGMPVVAYCNNGSYSARFWWLLRWLGHENVAVLDGGLAAWQAAGLPVTASAPTPAPGHFVPHLRPELTMTMEAVRNRPPQVITIDSRAAERFAGQPHPLDPKQGHVPGAVNHFWGESLRPDGTWRSPAEQAARFAGLPPGAELVCYCGSGVTACANLIALYLAGYREARLYPGSWSDWCTYPENLVQVGEVKE